MYVLRKQLCLDNLETLNFMYSLYSYIDFMIIIFVYIYW